MTFETIQLATDDRGIATITLNRPDKHNAMSGPMIEELQAVADELASDEAVRAIVLTGEGKSFCAGGDLNGMKMQFTASRADRIKGAKALAHMLKSFNELPKPLIGRINGPAYGGGVGLVSVCDVAIVADTAKLGLTEVRIGMIPATISPYVLARMGETCAREVFFSGRVFAADEAVRLNLCSHAVPEQELDKAIERAIAPYMAAAPQAIARSKALTRRFGTVIDEAQINATIEALADTWEGEEAQEGISAFLEKRKPRWADGT